MPPAGTNFSVNGYDFLNFNPAHEIYVRDFFVRYDADFTYSGYSYGYSTQLLSLGLVQSNQLWPNIIRSTKSTMPLLFKS